MQIAVLVVWITLLFMYCGLQGLFWCIGGNEA